MTPRTNKPRAAAAVLLLSTLYAGVLLGCSFLATSAKFLAPSLTVPVALDVGRHTFGVLLVVEWIFALPLLGLTWFACNRRHWAMMVAVVVMLAAESLWLRPILDARVARIIAGQPVVESGYHLYYIACEVGKVLLLLSLALSFAWSLAWRREPGCQTAAAATEGLTPPTANLRPK